MRVMALICPSRCHGRPSTRASNCGCVNVIGADPSGTPRGHTKRPTFRRRAPPHSGYYAACRRSRVQPVVCEAGVQLKAAFAASGGAYGSRRLRTTVESRGVVIGIYRVRRLMRQHGLRSVWKRKFVQTTDSKHALSISPNVLDRQFNPTRPNQAWVADITYIRTRSGWLYLAVVLDLYARKVAGWAMAPDMQATLVCRAHRAAPTGSGIDRAFGSRQPVRQRCTSGPADQAPLRR